MVGAKVTPVVSDILRADDFYRPSHGFVFTAALALYAKGEPVDALTVVAELERRDDLDKAGGKQRVHELAALVPATANAAHYARLVKEQSVYRSLVEVGQEISDLGWKHPKPADELVDQASGLVYSLSSQRTRSDLTLIGQDPQSFLDKLEERRRGDTGVKLGFPTFDGLTTGLKPGNLAILAAGTSVGKSAFAISAAYHLAVSQNKPVALFTLEMSKTEIDDRMVAIVGRVPLQDLRTGHIDSVMFPRMIDGLAELSKAPLYVDDTSALSLVELRSKLRRLRSIRPDVCLAVVDYLQLMTPPGGESRYEQVTQIARGLKHLAQDMQMPVLALSQLNRNREMRSDKRPILSDLRESGEIEQAADLVAFLHRADNTLPEAELLLRKQRNGPLGEVGLTFLNRSAMFTEADNLHSV